MTGCTTCGGYGNRHDPIAHDAEPTEVDDEPRCQRFPVCESPINNWYQGAVAPCTWPDCVDDGGMEP